MGMRAHLLPSARALARGWRSTATVVTTLSLAQRTAAGKPGRFEALWSDRSFGLFDGVSKERYRRIVAAAPFDKCNLLILAFVRTFGFDRPPADGGPIYVAQFANGRLPELNRKKFPLDPNDTDGDRVKLIVETARKKNPSINILISLGSGNADLVKAAKTPIKFADSVRALVQAYDLNGFDIDFENTDVTPAAMLTLAKQIRHSLNKIPSTRPMIMTIAPDKPEGLNKDVLEQFTYVMAQTYGHALPLLHFRRSKFACSSNSVHTSASCMA